MVRSILEGASLLSLSRELDAAGVTTREGRCGASPQPDEAVFAVRSRR
jgi:hypothetical protein